MGLSESAAEFFPDAAWQRCIVHWSRNIFSHVPSTKVREIAAMLKAIHAGEDIVAARQKAVQVIEKWPAPHQCSRACGNGGSRRYWPTTASRSSGGSASSVRSVGFNYELNISLKIILYC